MTPEGLTLANTASLADYQAKKSALVSHEAEVRRSMEEGFTSAIAEAQEMQRLYKEEFGTYIPFKGQLRWLKKDAPSPSAAIGPKVGGLKRSIAAAQKRGDEPLVKALEAKLAALQPLDTVEA